MAATSRNTPLRILCYAVNGLGLGHLTRLIAICRQLRRLTTALNTPAEIIFLTSSEGDALAFEHDFAAFKIPSKTLAKSCRLDPHRYRKIAKQWVWNAINLIAPDILIVDTFPAGSFNELYDVLDLGSKNVFIYRAVRDEIRARPAFQAALGGYDLILRPGEGADSPADDLPPRVRDRAVNVGPILLRSAAEMHEKAEARELLGLPPETPAVYISTGGGGDHAAQALLQSLVTAARQLSDLRFVLGAGLLYRGREWAAPNVVWTRRPALASCFRAFDAAITAGGFNTVWELMHAGVPCLFVPQPRGWDDQAARADRCVRAGAGELLPDLSPETVGNRLRRFLLPENQLKMAAAARSLLPRNDALRAAEEILSLVMRRERVEWAGLLINDALLFEASRAQISEDDLLRLATRLRVGDTIEAAEEALTAALFVLSRVTQDGGTVRDAFALQKQILPDTAATNAAAQIVTLWEQEKNR